MKSLGRQTLTLDGPWGFQTDPDLTGLRSGWHAGGLPVAVSVSVPHTWNVQPETEHFRGLGWYEYRFATPELREGGRVWLHFEAVYRDAVVWINGEEAGRHVDSGYTAFRIEATPFLKAEGDNLLVISVHNGNSDTALPKGNSFDWADDGGIIRGVSMIVAGETVIDTVEVTALPKFPAGQDEPVSGTVSGKLTLHGARTTEPSPIRLEAALLKDGAVVWTGTDTAVYPCSSISLPDIALDNVDLWHFDHPHRYELNLRLVADGLVQDEVTVTVGFREFITEGSRFLLNREPVRLTGVEWMPGSHPDTGMAESEEDIKRVLIQLKAANAVLTRFHWQQSERLLEWCDRYGILVQEEIPLWQQPSEPGEETAQLVKRQLREMITRHMHHPSVVAWGVGNELDGQSAQTVRYVREMKAYIKELDASRLVNYVSNTVHLNPAADATGAGDVIMWNDYIGTWHGEHDIDETVQKMIAAHPDKPIVVAEFGLCEPAFTGGDERRSEQMLEKMAVYRRYPEIAGMIYFNLNDYRTQMGEEGEGRLRQRVHGVTDVYGAEKPSYRLLQEVSSPLTMDIVPGTAAGEWMCRLACTGHLPHYTVSGYSLHAEPPGSSREQVREIPVLLPGDRTDILIGTAGIAGPIKVTVRRPSGFGVLERWIGI